MAYDFFPQTPYEVSEKIKDNTVASEISHLLISLQAKFQQFKDPLAIDLIKPKQVKITRKVQTAVDIKQFQRNYSQIKLSFGEGSRGNRGSGNRGNLFEYELAQDITRWWIGEDVKNSINLELIKDLEKTYELKKWTDLFVDAEGAENKPRPLQINGNNVIISPGLQDIGSVVTDITLRKGKNKTSPAGVFLSLKFSGTVTFFNSGTKKYLTDQELEKGLIKNPGGIALLNMFGINNAVFCSVFNGKGKNFESVDTTRFINKPSLENLIKSGIGYGFHMVHKVNNNKMISKKIDKTYRDRASEVNSVVVYYGGKSGNAARVDIDVTTPKYILKFNFRNKQGGRYISHLMCDYKYV